MQRGAGARARSVLVAGAGALLLSGVQGTGPATAAPEPVKVSMKEFAFSPASVTVAAGTTVTWTYDESKDDPAPNCESVFFQSPSPLTCPGHSTTATGVPAGAAKWDSGVHRAGGFPYSVTLTVPGTYTYVCTVHGGANPNNPVTHMDGTITVTPAPSGANASASGGGATGALGTTGPVRVSAATAAPSGAPGGSTTPATGAPWGLGAVVPVLAGALAARRLARLGPPAA